MDIKNKQFPSIEQMTLGLQNKQSLKNVNSNKTESFIEVLKQKRASKDLVFSKHANDRLVDRNIVLSHTQMQRLETGTNKALEKGIKESLVMVDDLAFIVNVPNKVVITAVNQGEEKTFTNIDGAVIT